MNPPPATPRQLAELVPLTALKSATDVLGLWTRQWDSHIGGRGHVNLEAYDKPVAATAVVGSQHSRRSP